MTDWKNHFTRPTHQFGFGASAGDVIRYRNLWTPYVRGVVEAARDCKLAEQGTKDFAEMIARAWNAYAGTSPGELLIISDSALKVFQRTVKSALILGQHYWIAYYPVPEPPTESEQSSVINALEDSKLVAQGVLEILGKSMSVEALQAGAGVVGETAGTLTGSLLGGVSKGIGTGGKAVIQSSGIPTWVWIMGAGLAAAMIPAYIASNPLFHLGRLAKRF